MPRAKKPKSAPESPRLPKAFDSAALLRRFRTHRVGSALGSWTLDQVEAAIASHIGGRFRASVGLARKMQTDPAIFGPRQNRGAPHRGLPREVFSAEKLKAGSPANILAECNATFAGATSASLPFDVLSSAFDGLAMMGIHVLQIHWEARSDGSRLDAFASNWPLDSVEWDEHAGCLMALAKEGRTPIVHGDGRWVVIQKSREYPWQEGAIIPLGKVLGSRAYAVASRTRSGISHGDDKWLGVLPENAPTDGPDAEHMLEEMMGLYEERRAMLIPAGGKVERSVSNATNYQIFKETIESDNKDAMRILLGQDGTMTNTGGNYIKSWGLFGVRNDIVESDLVTMGACVASGLLRPWSLMNFGRWDNLGYRWLMPDADEDARRDSIIARRKAFFEDIASARQAGMNVDDDYVSGAAKVYGLDQVPVLKPAPVDVPPVPVASRTPLRPVYGG